MNVSLSDKLRYLESHQSHLDRLITEALASENPLVAFVLIPFRLSSQP